MTKVKTAYKKNPHVARLLVIMVLWMIFMAATKFDKFYTFANFKTIASQFPEFGLMSLGVMLCMTTGGNDLSTVGVANFTAIICAFIMTAMGGEAGVISAVTMGVNELMTGISIVMTGGSAYSSFPKGVTDFIGKDLFGVLPVRLVIFVVVAVIIWFVMEKTTYGTKIRLLGTGEKVAIYSGMKTNRIFVRTYATSGMCSALGGLLMLGTYASARADYGSQYILQSILIVVLGGINPNGGHGKMSGVILAMVVLKMLESGINRFPSVSSYYISLIWGGVLLLSMVLDYFTADKRSRG